VVCFGYNKKGDAEMKKIFALVLAVIAAISSTLLFYGCNKATDDTTADSNSTTGTITLSGSTSVKPLADALAEAFMEINDGVQVDIQEGGSSVGISDAIAKKVDLGMSSRELKPEETGLNQTIIAFDGIAVIVNNDVNVTNLTTQQLKDIYTGKVKNWSGVGGAAGAIIVVGRDAASGTRGAFEELLKIDGKSPNPKAVYAQEKDSTGAVKATVQSTKNSIGYVSFEAVDATVKTVTLDNIAITVDTVKDNLYPLVRPFLLVNSKDTALSAAATAFINFILSDDGQQIVTDQKFVSVN
jgi:phosphate transport system substrate-binding protein